MIQIRRPIIPTTISIPTQTPASKMPSITSQLENNVITKNNKIVRVIFFFMAYLYDGLCTVKLRRFNKNFII